RPARLSRRGEEGRAAHLRRLGASPVLRGARPDAHDAARRPEGDRAGQHRRPDLEADEAVRPEARVDHRVRLPDYAARRILRRELAEAGALSPSGLRDRESQPAYRPVHVVPAARQPVARKLAVRAHHRGRAEEAVVRCARAPRSEQRLIEEVWALLFSTSDAAQDSSARYREPT